MRDTDVDGIKEIQPGVLANVAASAYDIQKRNMIEQSTRLNMLENKLDNIESMLLRLLTQQQL